jgi:hypothetical protein
VNYFWGSTEKMFLVPFLGMPGRYRLPTCNTIQYSDRNIHLH